MAYRTKSLPTGNLVTDALGSAYVRVLTALVLSMGPTHSRCHATWQLRSFRFVPVLQYMFVPRAVDHGTNHACSASYLNGLSGHTIPLSFGFSRM